MTKSTTTSIPTTALRLQVDEQGRVVIPPEIRHALGFEPGEVLVAQIKDGRLIMRTFRAMSEELWATFAGYEGSMADELIAERRAEAEREMREWQQDEARREHIAERRAKARSELG
jgi:AbrB family looped-hinge helix DNA binding protein